jgi:hypothetical protein
VSIIPGPNALRSEDGIAPDRTQSGLTRTVSSSAFYVVADSRHFVGLVALLNSLRLVGHDEPIYVGDCGLADGQHERLGEHVTLVPITGSRAPHLVKTIVPLAYPADVMLLIDGDMIVTRSLAPLLEEARAGRLVAFVDRISHRFDERWSELLGLGPLRRQSYVNSGLVAAESQLGTTLLHQIAEGCARIDVTRTMVANGRSEYPFYYLDQDVLNAVLASTPSDRLQLLDHRLAPLPPFAGVRLVDDVSLRCSYEDGLEPYVLHHILRKPWLEPTRWNVYSHLLARLVLDDDVTLRLAPDELPLRLRPGAIAWLEKRRSDVAAIGRSMRGRLGIRGRLTGHVRSAGEPAPEE